MNTRAEIDRDGYCVIRKAGPEVLVDILESLGRVIHVEDVVVTADSQALLKSAGGLSPHTDHHRARRIVWYCLAQASNGGETVLIDGRKVFLGLDVDDRSTLGRVLLSEHSVFTGDQRTHPMVVIDGGVPRIYYSLWLAGDLPDVERAAFDAFSRAVERAEPIALRLEPGDVLAIDNTRMLHGRRAIGGDGDRHLRRYWLED